MVALAEAAPRATSEREMGGRDVREFNPGTFEERVEFGHRLRAAPALDDD